MVKYQLMTELKHRNESLLEYQTKLNREMAELKTDNFQLALKNNET